MSTSTDGRTWRLLPGAKWTASTIDPGFGVVHSATTGGLLAVARMQSIRKSGRHMGAHQSATWAELGRQNDSRLLPLVSIVCSNCTAIAAEHQRFPATGLPRYRHTSDTSLNFSQDDSWSNFSQHYGLPPFGYHGHLVSFLWRYYCDCPASYACCIFGDVDIGCQKDQSKCGLVNTDDDSMSAHPPPMSGGKVDAMLAVGSNEGQNWSLFGGGDGLPLFANVAGTPSSGQVYPNSIVEIPSPDGSEFDGGRLLVHASASTAAHGAVAPDISSLLTFELRVDGFVGILAEPGSTGMLRTRTLVWGAGELALNIACAGAGSSARTQILNRAGSLVAGYSFAESASVHSNSTALLVQWSGQKKLAALAGKAVQIEVQLRGACTLFSLRAVDVEM